MNRLIADSGASKTDWVLLGDGSPQFIQTEGLNPHLLTSGEFLKVLVNELKPNLLGRSVEEIRFFGSGCGSPEKKREVEQYLREVFEFAEISVGTDLDAAGIALFGKESGLVGILGTGSSAAYFENGEVADQMPSVGFPEGDEGSGSYIGKRIMKLYASGDLHMDLRYYLDHHVEEDIEKMTLMFKKTKEAKLFAGEICKVMGPKAHYPQIQQIIHDGFRIYLTKVKEHFPDEVASQDMSFVGSIASIFESELRSECRQMGIEVGSVVRSPVEHLGLYFRG
ncbi:MAG: hypothetical protein U5K71_10125 [Gracilimonas sp.]|nr:hypothetical protein [Gracilimonas sp.]